MILNLQKHLIDKSSSIKCQQSKKRNIHQEDESFSVFQIYFLRSVMNQLEEKDNQKLMHV